MKAKIRRSVGNRRIILLPKEGFEEFQVGDEVEIQKPSITPPENLPDEGKDKTYGMGGEILKLIRSELEKHVAEYH